MGSPFWTRGGGEGCFKWLRKHKKTKRGPEPSEVTTLSLSLQVTLQPERLYVHIYTLYTIMSRHQQRTHIFTFQSNDMGVKAFEQENMCVSWKGGKIITQ